MTRAVTSFEKWEGLGNDFIVVSGPSPSHAQSASRALTPMTLVTRITPERARELCDRRRGVGGDGVLVVAGLPEGRPRMIVYNADGSRPEMCGNGLRCVAAHLAARGVEARGSIVVATDSGDKACLVERVGPDLYEVTVAMGKARMTGDLAVSISGRVHHFTTVDVGNPHAITFEPYDQPSIDVVGPLVEAHVSGGTNVEFCRVAASPSPSGTRIEVTVWERGVGRTLACGTGACAVAAAACEEGRAPYGEPIAVALPGGELTVTVGRELRDLVMRGPARRVFAGEVLSA